MMRELKYMKIHLKVIGFIQKSMMHVLLTSLNLSRDTEYIDLAMLVAAACIKMRLVAIESDIDRCSISGPNSHPVA